MRALLVRPGPNFSVQDVANGWQQGLTEAGVEVRDFDLGAAMAFYEMVLRTEDDDSEATGRKAAYMAASALRAAAFDWWPDIVLIVSSFFVPPETYQMLRARRMKVVTLFTESPYEDTSQQLIAAHTDVAIVNDPTNLAGFQTVNPNSFYLPHAYNPHVHCPGPATDEFRSEFCFVGTGYPSRIGFFEQCDLTGIDVALAGNWANLGEDSPLRKHVAHDLAHCLENSDAVEMYRSTLISANIYRTEHNHDGNADGWAMGPREVELAACGTFFLTQERGENRDILPMVPTFEGPADLSDAIRWWLAHPDLRADVAAEAQAAVADRTFTNHARQLLAWL